MTAWQKRRIREAGIECESELKQAAWCRGRGFIEAAENHEAAAAMWSEIAFRAVMS